MKITPERWRRIRTIFEAAVDRPAEEREAYLDEACAGDTELLRQVGSLIVAGSGADEALGDAVADAAADVAAAARVGIPKRVGRYRILDTIGEGGMGLVLLGERDDDSYRQKVAVKIIKRALAGEDAVRRFETERQILADLDDPAVARLVDGGTTEEGVPYLVMEYIEGRPIDVYCREEGLGVDERIRLFIEVCDAVAHAHQHLIVHRDLKPSNIIVTDDGDPKLLDFGIAKMLDPERVGVGLTGTGLVALTPEYASPEQVLGEPITTASDVYSLGVLLYELLVGRSPYGDSIRTPAAILKAICEDRPERPSDARRRASTEEKDAAAVSSELGGELDWILLTALRKEPDRRYASVEELAQDLRALLEGRPVKAHPDTWSYRTGKWFRRHWKLAATGALVIAALIGGTISTKIQSDRARNEAATAHQVTDFLVELFEVSDPYQVQPEQMTAQELLDRGRERIDRELAGQPQVRARLMLTIGIVYHHLGLHEDAESLLTAALELQRRVHGPQHLDVAEAQARLAKLMETQARWDAAVEYLHQALDIRRDILGEDDLLVAATLDELAFALRRGGRFQEAETAVRRALGLYQSSLGDGDDIRLAMAKDNLGSLLAESGDDAGAEPLLREALAMKRRIYPQGQISVLNALNHLGDVLQRVGNHDEAEALLGEALELSRRLFGDEHPMVASVLNRRGTALSRRGELTAAEELLRESLDMRERLLGEDHPDVSESLNNLAVVLREQEKYVEAEAMLRRSIALDRRQLGDAHPYVAQGLGNLASIADRRAGCSEAEPILREALEVYSVAFPGGHPHAAVVGCRLGRCLVERGEVANGTALLEHGLEYLMTSDPSSPYIAECTAVEGGTGNP